MDAMEFATSYESSFVRPPDAASLNDMNHKTGLSYATIAKPHCTT